MSKRPRRFERFVRVTYPGLDWGGRMLLLELVVLCLPLGLGLGLIESGIHGHARSDARRVAEVGSGSAILCAELIFVIAYLVTLIRAVRADQRTEGEGRHAA